MFVKVYTESNFSIAALLVNELDNNGFHPMKLNTSEHISLAGSDTSYFIEVPQSEAKAVKEFLIANGYSNGIIGNI